MKDEHKLILDYLNKHLPLEVKRKFDHSESLIIVKLIHQLIEEWDELEIEQNEPDFMKKLKNLHL